MTVTIYPICVITRCVLKGLLSQCVLFLSKTLYALLSTGSTKEDRKSSRHDWKIVDCDVKHQYKQNKLFLQVFS